MSQSTGVITDPEERAKMSAKLAQLTIRDDTSLFDMSRVSKEFLEYSVRDIPVLFITD